MKYEETLALTEDRVRVLQEHRIRTSVGPQALLKPYGAKRPQGLNHAMVTHWLGGRINQVKKVHYDFVIEAWAALEDDPSVELTDEILSRLRMLRQTSGIPPEILLRHAAEVPDGLTPAKVQQALDGSLKTLRLRYLTFLQKSWGDGG
ncbi:MAG: hypothetical protein QNI84_14150 [Henriciella sp.]|nr:hypothetical protein [Henriciella sp.]